MNEQLRDHPGLASTIPTVREAAALGSLSEQPGSVAQKALVEQKARVQRWQTERFGVLRDPEAVHQDLQHVESTLEQVDSAAKERKIRFAAETRFDDDLKLYAGLVLFNTSIGFGLQACGRDLGPDFWAALVLSPVAIALVFVSIGYLRAVFDNNQRVKDENLHRRALLAQRSSLQLELVTGEIRRTESVVWANEHADLLKAIYEHQSELR